MLIPTITPTLHSNYIDQTANDRLSTELLERIQLELEKLLKQDITSKKKVLRNVLRQFYEENNNREEYERIIRDTENDDNVNGILRLLLDDLYEN